MHVLRRSVELAAELRHLESDTDCQIKALLLQIIFVAVTPVELCEVCGRRLPPQR